MVDRKKTERLAAEPRRYRADRYFDAEQIVRRGPRSFTAATHPVLTRSLLQPPMHSSRQIRRKFLTDIEHKIETTGETVAGVGYPHQQFPPKQAVP